MTLMDFLGAGFSSKQPTREEARALYTPEILGFMSERD